MKADTANLQEFAADNKIEIEGIENIPKLAITPIMTSNPFDDNDEDIYVGKDKYITMAKIGDKIHHHKQVSDQFKVTQYYQTIHTTLESILQDSPEFGKPTVKLKFSTTGGNMFAVYRFPEQEYNLASAKKKEDKVIPQIVVKDAIDLSGKFEAITGYFRFVCSNGLMIAHPDFKPEKFRMMHKQGTYQLGDALASMNDSLAKLSDGIGLWKTYMKEKITTLQLVEIMDVAGMNISQQIKAVQLPLLGATGTLVDNVVKGKVSAWTAYNALTQFATHEIKNPKTEFELGEDITRSFDHALGIY